MEEPRGFQRLFIFYDRDVEDATLPTIATEWDAVACHVNGNVATQSS